MRNLLSSLLMRVAHALDLVADDRRSLEAEESPAAEAYLRAQAPSAVSRAA